MMLLTDADIPIREGELSCYQYHVCRTRKKFHLGVETPQNLQGCLWLAGAFFWLL